MFSVNVLLYGDNVTLAKRCLSSLLSGFSTKHIADVRIGLNAVGKETLLYARSFASRIQVPCHLYRATNNKNVLKYPMMRRMFYDPERPLLGTHVMWFDDDSYLDVYVGKSWWDKLENICKNNKPAVLGSIYRPGFNWSQLEMRIFEEQPWYTGITLTSRPKFVTGGFWVADLEFMAKWDYPVRELKHNGGDTLLGEICRQQHALLLQFNELVHINADASGRESAAPRRGSTTARPFQSVPPYDYSHHDFDITVETFDAAQD